MIRNFFRDPFGLSGYKQALRDMGDVVTSAFDRHADATNTLACRLEKLLESRQSHHRTDVLLYPLPRFVPPSKERENERRLKDRLTGE